ncbi:hypothetical protein EKO04_003538 [Ascochyta lentis]|uniref:C2H2-type domain-containing protein n=1 Tax=Ascochyta lentis TaxID=205686 RepID=A0A8H7MEX0_9PLEO|nr:hypothetical protein EKO04_003538 [Ascochyta lentis]
MSMRNRLPSGIAREQIRVAQQNRNNAPSNWLESTRTQPPFREGNPVQTVDAGQSQAGVNAAPSTNRVDGSHNVHIKDSNSFTYWACPKCQSQWAKTPERLMNLARTGRYFFECSGENCGTSLVVIKRKDSALDTVEELREPLVEGELTIHGKNEILPTPRTLEKRERRRRITQKLERVKTSWTNSKYFFRKKGMAVAGTLGRMSRLRLDLDTHDSVTVATVPSESNLHPRFDVPSLGGSSHYKFPTRAKSETWPGRWTLASQPSRSLSEGGGRDRRGYRPREPLDSQRFSPYSNTSPDQASLASGRTNQAVQKSKAVPSPKTAVVGTLSNVPTQPASQKGKAPVKDGDLMLQCRFCSMTFFGDETGDDALLEHVTSSHSEMGGNAEIRSPSTELGRVMERKPCESDKFSLYDEDEESILCDDDEELFPQCKYCPHTFNSDQGRLKHQAEQHPDEVETFPQCGHCEATFKTKRMRNQHVEDVHPFCRNCRAAFETKTARDEHEQRAHPH